MSYNFTYRIYFGEYYQKLAEFAQKPWCVNHFYPIHQQFKFDAAGYNETFRSMASTRVKDVVWKKLVKEIRKDYKSLIVRKSTKYGNQMIYFKDPADYAAFMLSLDVGYEICE